MLNLEAVLPEIERAVDKRVESSTLASMDAAALRDLVYKLVARQGSDPSRHFAELIENASERHTDMESAREHSVTIRAKILRHLLQILEPVLPALFGTVVTRVITRPDDHDIAEPHSLLTGFELLNYEKWGPVGDREVRSGCSWWIVGLKGEGRRAGARYARVVHHGQRYEDVFDGSEENVFELVTSAEAAAEIRDNQIPKIVRGVHGRLISVSGKKIAEATDDLWKVTTMLDSALEAMTQSA